MKCRAITGKRPNEYGFVNIECGQTVGVRSYWAANVPVVRNVYAKTLQVGYCARDGHERSVRVRFAEVDPPEPVYLHELPEYADDMTYAKWTADRNETDAGWTIGELMEGYGK